MDNKKPIAHDLMIDIRRISNRLAYHWDKLNYVQRLLLIAEIKQLLTRLINEEYKVCSDH